MGWINFVKLYESAYQVLNKMATILYWSLHLEVPFHYEPYVHVIYVFHVSQCEWDSQSFFLFNSYVCVTPLNVWWNISPDSNIIHLNHHVTWFCILKSSWCVELLVVDLTAWISFIVYKLKSNMQIIICIRILIWLMCFAMRKCPWSSPELVFW